MKVIQWWCFLRQCYCVAPLRPGQGQVGPQPYLLQWGGDPVVPASRCPAGIHRLLHLPGHVVGTPNPWPRYPRTLSSCTLCVIYPWFIQVDPLRSTSVFLLRTENKRQKPIRAQLSVAHPNLRVCSPWYAADCSFYESLLCILVSPSCVCFVSFASLHLLQSSSTDGGVTLTAHTDGAPTFMDETTTAMQRVIGILLAFEYNNNRRISRHIIP